MDSKLKDKHVEANGPTLCVCCGTICKGLFCKQCQFAGCGKNKVGQTCLLKTMKAKEVASD